MTLPCLTGLLLPLAIPPEVARPETALVSTSIPLTTQSVQMTTESVLYGPAAGEYLLGFSANYRYARAAAPDSDADETEVFTGRATAGLFFTREHEAGLEIAPSYLSSELGGRNLDLYVGAYYNYNVWTSPQANFYYGPQLGLLYTDPTGSSGKVFASLGVHGGLRYWLDPSVSLNVEPRLSFTSLDRARGGDETIFDISFGISFKF